MLGIDTRIARSAWSHAAVYAAVIVLIAAVWVVRKTLLVFATALLLAYLLFPFVDGLERRMTPRMRILALILPFIVVVGAFSVFAYFIGQPLQNEYKMLVTQVQERGFRNEIESWRLVDYPVGKHLTAILSENGIINVMPQLSSAMRTAVRYGLNLFIIPILAFFILKDGRKIRDAFLRICDNPHDAERLLVDVHVLLLEYMRSLLFLCIATLAAYLIVLSAMRVRYPILLALFASPLEFIPAVGPLISGLTILGVCKFNHYPHLWWVLLFLIGYRVFQDYVLSPHLMKRGVKLDPLIVIFGVFAGEEIGRVPGIFLSVPVIALLRLAIHEWYRSRRHAAVHHTLPSTSAEEVAST